MQTTNHLFNWELYLFIAVSLPVLFALIYGEIKNPKVSINQRVFKHGKKEKYFDIYQVKSEYLFGLFVVRLLISNKEVIKKGLFFKLPGYKFVKIIDLKQWKKTA